MARSASQKRKRKFYGNRYTKEQVVSSKNSFSTVSASKLNTQKDDSAMCEKFTGNRIIDVNIIETAFSELCCPTCFSPGVSFVEDSRYGLCSHFSIKCQQCDFAKGFASSNKQNNVAEINSRFVYGLRQIGRGHEASKKLCATLNMPPPLSKAAFVSHQKKLFAAVSSVAHTSMKRAANEVIDTNVSVEVDSECGVSLDGTWQKRGYSSLNGCVAALSVDTGKVLDVEILSSYCRICKNIEREKSNTIQLSLKADHDCSKNYSGSASHMEVVGVTKIFERSLQNNNLKYTHYYGDGDSKGFKKVKDTYGEDSVVKMECIGHIQKRVGSHLRKLKTKMPGLSGKGKLTDTFIDTFIESKEGISYKPGGF